MIDEPENEEELGESPIEHIRLPEDDFDEDDEWDERMAEYEKRQRNTINRGTGLYGTQ